MLPLVSPKMFRRFWEINVSTSLRGTVLVVRVRMYFGAEKYKWIIGIIFLEYQKLCHTK